MADGQISPVYNPIQTVKRRLFAMRNGVIADVLRRSGSPFRIIFGVNLPQLVDIAKETGMSEELALALWHDTATRESMLLAPLIYPRENLGKEAARKWIAEVPAPEVADILCHRLLRHQPYAAELALEVINEESATDLEHYTALRLSFNIIRDDSDVCETIARTELKRDCPLTRNVAAALLEELEFLNGFSSG